MADNGRDGQDEDAILKEVRQVREALFADASYDIYEFCRALGREAGEIWPLSIRRRGSVSKDICDR